MQVRELFLTVHPDDIVKQVFDLKIHPKALTRSGAIFQHNTAYLKRLCRLINSHLAKVVFDSPGFEIVRGKLPKLTIDQVCSLYKRLYVEVEISEKLFVHFDVPTPFYAPKDVRISLLKQNYSNYVTMIEKLGKSFPLLYVVHGWTEDEIRLSIELFESERIVATPSYLAETHARAVRTGQYGFSSINKVAFGSYMMLKNPRVGVVSETELLQYYVKTVPKKAVWERLAKAMNLLRDKYEVFVLGGSSPNTCHLIFLAGAKAIDGSSWTFAAKLGRIFIPEYGEVRPEHVEKNERVFKLMQEYWNRPDNPLKDTISLHQFLEFTSEPWRKQGIRHVHEGYIAWMLRATWNLYVMHIEEEIANEYATDFDRYVKYLEQRFRHSSYLKNVLKTVVKNIKKPYVQTRLDIYFKMDDNIKNIL